MKTRLKTLRKNLHLTQDEFSKTLGVSRTAYAKYENGLVLPSATFIKLVCEKFSINEEWLRTGEGEIQEIGENPLLTELKKKYHLDVQDEIIMSSFLELAPEHRTAVKNFIRRMADEMHAAEDRSRTIQIPPSAQQ